jgi:hypothetical protein
MSTWASASSYGAHLAPSTHSPLVRTRTYAGSVNDLLDEARRMPDASVRFARGVSQVGTPQHLVGLRTRVRSEHRGQLTAVHHEIDERFGTTGASDDYINVFYAASEMARAAWPVAVTPTLLSARSGLWHRR